MVIDSIVYTGALHFLGDFPLQDEFLKKYKDRSLYLLGVHCWIYSAVTYWGLSHFFNAGLWAFIALFVSHMIIDYWKCEARKKLTEPEGAEAKKQLYIDQGLHIAVLGVIIYVLLL